MDEKEKEITITNLQAKTVAPRPGQTFKAFTVYQIVGNDGITYETPQKEFFAARKIGEVITFKYVVVSKTSGGKVYTSYRISLPTKESVAADLSKKEILYSLKIMEKNIIAAIELHSSGVKIKGPADVPTPPKPAEVKPAPAVAKEVVEEEEDYFPPATGEEVTDY